MDFIEKGDCAVFLGQVTDSFNWTDGTAHAVDGFEGYDFGNMGGEAGEFGLEVFEIVMFEDYFLCTGVPDTLDHRGMVQTV